MDWTRQGPSLSELISESRDERKERSRLAIVMPSFRKKGMLTEHLSRLSRQSMRDFDILIVYGRDDEFVDTPKWASILHMREKGRNGSAGNFYAGCKKAFSDGYEYIIITDNDCLPESDGLIQALYRSAEGGAHVSMPLVRLGGLKRPLLASIHTYACIRREVFASVGLTYLPIFFGGEDPELSDRISGGGYPITKVDSLVSHPLAWSPFISSQSRLYLYSRGGLVRHLIGGNLAGSWASIFLGLMAGLSMICIGKAGMAKGYFRAMLAGSALELFSGPDLPDERPPKLTAEPEGIYLGEDELGFGDGLNMGAPGQEPGAFRKGLFKSLSYFRDFGKYFGKSVIIEYINEMSELPIILMSRSAYLSVGKDRYLIAKDRGKAAILGGLILLLFAAVPMAALSSVLLARGLLTRHFRGIKTKGYGVPRAEGSGR